MEEGKSSAQRASALFWVFGVCLLVNVVLTWFHGADKTEPPLSEEAVTRSATALTVAEAVDSIVIIALFLAMRKVVTSPLEAGRRKRLAVWLAIPTLAVLLAINTAYHTLLLNLAGIRPEADELLSSGHHIPWLLVLYCLQPAIIEELFCRRLVFDFFCQHTTVGTAAFASAAMFAAMHTGALSSFPYFVVFGVTMAWLRWWSGSLALPVLLHFAHNFLISIHELSPA